MRISKIIIGICIIMCMVFVFGCSETDDGTVILMDNGIIDNSSIDTIEYPKRVTVYEVRPWEKKQEELSEVFLNGDIIDEIYIESYLGWKTETDFGDYTEYLQSLGRENNTLDVVLQGIHYEVRRKSDMVCRMYGEYEQKNVGVVELMDCFTRMSRFPKIEGEQSENKSEKKLVESYMNKLGFPMYEVRASVMVLSENKDEMHCMMYWQQVVDGIPISFINIPKDAQLEGTRVYNERFNHEVRQYDGILQTDIIDGELVYWDMLVGPVKIEKEVGSYEVISPQKAYQKVAECYRNAETKEPPRLELVELQYKDVMKDSRRLLVPVWTFAVVEKEHFRSEEGSDEMAETWCYYLIDAVSGEFFTDVEY